jgi:HSP20 family protein
MLSLTRKRWGSDVTPWRELEGVSDRMRQMFDPSFPLFTPVWSETTDWIPAVELVEEDNEYVLSAELPGLKKEDLDLSVEDNVLNLKGNKKLERDQERGRTYIRERHYGAFERSFTLPRNVDPDKITAEFHDGIVAIHMPKVETAKGRHIEIE